MDLDSSQAQTLHLRRENTLLRDRYSVHAVMNVITFLYIECTCTCNCNVHVQVHVGIPCTCTCRYLFIVAFDISFNRIETYEERLREIQIEKEAIEKNAAESLRQTKVHYMHCMTTCTYTFGILHL